MNATLLTASAFQNIRRCHESLPFQCQSWWVPTAPGRGCETRIDTSEQLDKFYHPAVFGIAEYENNTHHGGLPGFVQKGFDLTQGEPVNTYDLV